MLKKLLIGGAALFGVTVIAAIASFWIPDPTYVGSIGGVYVKRHVGVRVAREPFERFTYETRFVVSYKDETQVATWRDTCAAYRTLASKFARGMSSGSPGRTIMRCSNIFPAVARFSDGSMALFDVDQNPGLLWVGFEAWQKQNSDASEPRKVSWLRKGDGYRHLRTHANDAVSNSNDAAPYGGIAYWASYWRPGSGDQSIIVAHPGVPDDVLSQKPNHELPKLFVLEDAYSVGICLCGVTETCGCAQTISQPLPHDLMVELNALRDRSARFGHFASLYDTNTAGGTKQ